ncbi:NCS1 family nucleobase:cation symporter-1 [Sphingomonas oryzagri]
MSKGLWNTDLAPLPPAERRWAWYHFAGLWVGMVVAVPSWMLAAGLIEQGMSAMQATLTVLLGNIVILAPLMLIGHAGARYGVPYAVLARASFGTRGARVPALARAAVACGWYGIQTWIGGEALLTLLGVFLHRDLRGVPLPWLGIGVGQFAAFLLFWAVQLLFVRKGLGAVRRLETWTAPVKIIACAALVWWAICKAHGLGPIFSAPSAFAPGGARAGQFWSVFWPSLTAMVGFWGTLALNIPDFTRLARSQRDQMIGQAIGLPPTMGLIALAGVITTSATVVIYGRAIWDPVELSGTLSGPLVLIGLLVIGIDTISCNIAANLVCAAYDISSLSPERISYRRGALITALIGMAMMPWKLLATSGGYIFVWLTGYGALLGPIAGILIADHWLVRRTRLDVAALYRSEGAYRFAGGWNPVAIAAFLLGVLPSLPGFLATVAPDAFGWVPAGFAALYGYAWFVGLGIAFIFYWLAMAHRRAPEAIPNLAA